MHWIGILRRVLLTCGLVLGTLSTGQAAIAIVTVPNDAFDRDGNLDNVIPFGNAAFCDDGIRYQQVYLGSEIGSGNIGSIRFRVDANEFASGFVSYGGVTVTLSSTLATPETIRRRFSENVGPDVAVVFSGDFSTEITTIMGTPNPFSFEIPVDTPFEFDGSLANLLLDVTIADCYMGTPFALDAETGPTMNRQYAPDKDDELAAVLMAPPIGLVTEFVVSTPPPLPYSLGLGSNWTIVGHDGEGFMIDALTDGRMVVFWFTYDESGNQMWLIGVADNFIGDEASIEMTRVSGPVFGPGFDPTDRIAEVWGTIAITFFDCDSGEVTFISTLGLGSGTYQIQRIYTTEQSSCPL